MKKSILLSILIAVVFISNSQAQYFVSSYGVVQSFSMPYEVYDAVNYHYNGYNIVHTSQLRGGNSGYFEVVLQRGNIFVQVRMDSRGRIHERIIQNWNPVTIHNCHNSCGYHTSYYAHHHTNWNHNTGNVHYDKHPSKNKGHVNKERYEPISRSNMARYDSREVNRNQPTQRIIADNRQTRDKSYPTRTR